MPSEASPPRETGAPEASSPRGQGAPSEASSPATEELRRHPSSILFGIGALARRLILPWLFAFVVSGGRRSADVWFLLLVVPAAVIAVLEYVFVRYALGPEGLVVRRGLLFRSVRHVPYGRIQNIDLRENPLHRLLRVAEVQVQTASGDETEARIRVLSLDAVEALRRRVFAERARAEAAAAGAGGSRPPHGEARAVPAAWAPGGAERRTLLHLSSRDLAVFGLLNNRGAVVAAALLGLAWEVLTPDETIWTRLRPRELLPAAGELLSWVPPWASSVLAVALGLVALFAFMRVLSVGWAFATLHGFRLERAGEDLRTTGGLVTRTQVTVPRHRIQVLTLVEGWLARRFGRLLVQADTAGGGEDEGARGASRAWLAPILRRERLPGLLAEVLPDVDLGSAEWQPVSRRAFRRLLKKGALLSAVPVGVLVWRVGPAGWAALVPLLALVTFRARVVVRTTAWATLPTALAVRTGWWTRRTRVVRYAKMQVVSTSASPFDRRARMARLHVDVAAAGAAALGIPWLDREVADALLARLSREAERTRFRW